MRAIPYRDLPGSQYFWRRGSDLRWYNVDRGYAEQLVDPWTRQPPVPDDELVLTDPITCANCWSDTVEMEICPVCGHHDPERASEGVAKEALSRWTGVPIDFY
jgi:hypothetical protein